MKLFEHLVRDQNVLGFTFQWKIIIEANNTVDVGPLWLMRGQAHIVTKRSDLVVHIIHGLKVQVNHNLLNSDIIEPHTSVKDP